MTRLRRAALTASVVGVAGIGAALYLAATTEPAEERLRQRIEAERLFSFGRLSIAAMTVHRDDRAVEIVRDPTTGWRIDAPVRWPADLQAVEAIMDRTAALRAERTVYASPTRDELRVTELAEPRLRLEVRQTRGDRHRLALGSTNPVTELMHARADGGPVVLVDPAYRWTLDRPLRELRSKRLFPYRSRDVRSIRARSWSQLGFRLVQTNLEEFRVEAGGETSEADLGKAAVFLTAVTKRLEADAFLGDDHPHPSLPEELASYEPRSRFWLTVEHATGETRTATLALARRGAGGEPVPIAWVGPSVVELYPPPVDEILTTGAESLADRTLASFDPSEAHRLRITYGARPTWVFERDPGGSWQRVIPSPAEASGRVLKDVVAALSRLKGARTVVESPSRAQLEAWLIDPASRRFVVEGDKGQVLADVRLGNWANGHDELYARGEGPRIDAVSIDRVLRVPVDLEKYVRD